MKLIKLFLALFAATLAPQASAAPLQGEEAGEIYRLIGGQEAGLLQIFGYVTERATPPIEYTKANFGPAVGHMAPLSSSHDQMESVAQILEKIGVKARIYSGGTTYVEYLATVACHSADHCSVENFVP